MKLSIGQMRSVVVFRQNNPIISASTSRAAVTTGQNDVYADILTTRGRLRAKSDRVAIDLGLVAGESTFELYCRFDSVFNGVKVNDKVVVDGEQYTIKAITIIDQIKHWYKFDLAIQVLT